MSIFVPSSRGERVVDVTAAAVPAAAIGWSAVTLAPWSGNGAFPVFALAALVGFVPAYALMRMSGRRQETFVVPEFRVAEEATPRLRTFSPPPFEDELLLDVVMEEVKGEIAPSDDFADVRLHFASVIDDDDDVLLLKEAIDLGDAPAPVDRAAFDRRVEELSELILDDPLVAPAPDSRVVRLFAPQKMPTAGEMAEQIGRHIEHRDGPALSSTPDAGHALNEALDSLRHSLRRA